MLLTRQTGALHIGEVVRYTLIFTPSADRVTPRPAELWLKVRNTSAVPLRAAYLHGPYTLYTACYPADFDPNSKHDAQDVPQFEPFLKAGGNWDAVITIPSHLRKLEEPTSSGRARGDSVTWIIEISSQVAFSSSAVVHFEVLVGRDGNTLDFPDKRPPASEPAPSGQLHEHWTSATRGYQVSATKGVYSNSISLLIDDTVSLWNTPSLAPPDRKSTESLGEPESNQGSAAGIPENADENKSNEKAHARRKVHLVVLTHGLHSNLGADMLYLKECIDNATRRTRCKSKKDENCQPPNCPISGDSHQPNRCNHDDNTDGDLDDDAYEQVIVRGFPGNAGRTERGIQYLGKRLAKYVLLMTYPDQPYLPTKSGAARSSRASPGRLKPKAGIRADAYLDHIGHDRRAYQVTSISFIGHSLGGLVQTYAIAYMRKYSPQFFERIRPVNFIALATPFLGLSNENPMYIRFALDLGLVGRTGQDLGLSWTAPKVNNGWGSMVGGKADKPGKPQGDSDPGSKPLLRILPCGAAHEVQCQFQRRTIYSNAVNDGIVPLRTSSLLFLDWKGLDRVKKATRGNGLVGTMAEWGWAELSGANSKVLRPLRRNEEPALSEHEQERHGADETASGIRIHQLPGSRTATSPSILSSSRQPVQQLHPSGPHGRAEANSEETRPQLSRFGPFGNILSIFKPREPRSPAGPKQAKVYRRNQTIDAPAEVSPINGPSIAGGCDVHGEPGLNTPPKTSLFESAGDLLMPPLPSIDFILDPASRPQTIFHDRLYHPTDIPPPMPIKRRTLAIGSPRAPSPETTPGPSTSPVPMSHAGDSGLRVEEKIARAYHRGLSWRKVLVRLEPDAHNNIIVRRMFTNAHGWPVVRHLVDNHFGHESSEQLDEPGLDDANT